MCRQTVAGLCTNVVGALSFTGSDAIGLFHSNVLVDIIGSTTGMTGESCVNCPSGGGKVGVTKTGAPWDVAGQPAATYRHSLRRKSRVTEGTTDWFNPNGQVRQQRKTHVITCE